MKGIIYKPVSSKGLTRLVENCLGKEFIQQVKQKSKKRDNK